MININSDMNIRAADFDSDLSPNGKKYGRGSIVCVFKTKFLQTTGDSSIQKFGWFEKI